MTMHEIRRLLISRFWLLPLLALVGGGLGAAYAAVKTPTYAAKAYVVATANVGDSIAALNFAQAYGRVATSGPVLAKAGALLGVDRTELDSVTASTSPDAPVVEIEATGPSGQHAADVANAVAKALVAYGTARSTDTHVGLALLAGAVTPAKPSSPRPPLEMLIGAAGGLLIGGLTMLGGAGRPEQRPQEPADDTTAAWVDPIDCTTELPRGLFDVPAAIEEDPGAHERRAISAIPVPRAGGGHPAADPTGVVSPGRATGRVAVAETEKNDD